jgi:GntP family gluconate:H+ symporter
VDSTTSVIASPLLALVGFAGVIVLLLFLIAKWRWHVFLALLLPIVLFGLVPGVARGNFIEAFEKGFGNTLGQIGVVIVLGSVMAEALKHTGAIEVITQSMVNLVGSRRMPLALTLAGFVLGIVIFSDVAFVILNPLVHAAARTMGVGIAVMSTGLVGALQLTHAIVPPTPGPLAAAALLGADIGKTIVFGSIACLCGALASWIWGQYVAGPRIQTEPSDELTSSPSQAEGESRPLPGTWRAYAPIVVPVVLIAAQSVAKMVLDEDSVLRDILAYLGWPVVALGIGVLLAYRNIPTEEERKRATSEWVESGLRTSAMILVVTGLGGSLSAILRGTPAVHYLTQGFSASGLPALLLPFAIGIVGNMITGSTTVGVIAAGSLVAPMLDGLHLSPEAAMLAGASGSVIIKYVNSSYFWVCTSLSRLDVGDAILSYGGATLVGGITSFAAVYVMWVTGLV